MLKRIVTVACIVIGASAAAWAGNISLLSGPQPAGDLVSIFNNFIRTVNSSFGRIGVGTTAASTGANTNETTLQQYTLPGGTLANAGDSVRVSCWGVTATNSNNKTMKLYFGSSSIATPTAATSNKGWRLTMTVMRRTATTQAVDSSGLVDTTPVTPANSDGAETLSGAVLIKCTGTNGTASSGDITAQGLLVEAIR